MYVHSAHLNTDNLNGLIPSSQSTANSGSNDLIESTQGFLLTLAANPTDRILRETRETHTAVERRISICWSGMRTPGGHTENPN
jgi:hypothetical protein